MTPLSPSVLFSKSILFSEDKVRTSRAYARQCTKLNTSTTRHVVLAMQLFNDSHAQAPNHYNFNFCELVPFRLECLSRCFEKYIIRPNTSWNR